MLVGNNTTDFIDIQIFIVFEFHVMQFISRLRHLSIAHDVSTKLRLDVFLSFISLKTLSVERVDFHHLVNMIF